MIHKRIFSKDNLRTRKITQIIVYKIQRISQCDSLHYPSFISILDYFILLLRSNFSVNLLNVPITNFSQLNVLKGYYKIIVTAYVIWKLPSSLIIIYMSG